jgi:peptidoglycan/LPS O-acetylase OafA/YrhL
MMLSARHRPEIDGLRAIAVMSVVLYHASVPYISGGFVGVDIFFVISGYLITRILSQEIAEGNFSMVSFYERRIRRIFPALFVVYIASLFFALWLLSPFEFDEYADGLQAATLIVSNYHFMHKSGYFSAPAQAMPLLHTWSLSVEEQFYIIFPIYLVMIQKFAKRWMVPATTILLILSLFACIALTASHPDYAFYASPIRAWEILTGSVISLVGRPRPLSPAVAQTLGVLGVVMIGAAIFSFSDEIPFPGVHALLPTVGTALVIFSSGANSTMASSLLAFSPFQFVGLISYSVYLWHWPILVFYRLWRIEPLTQVEVFGLIAASVLLAILSWWLVELPFRRRYVLPTRPQLFAVGALSISVCVASSLSFGDGLSWRFPEAVLKAAAAHTNRPSLDRCALEQAGADQAIRVCAIGAPDRGKTRSKGAFAVWGDSHGEALAPGIDTAARNRHLRGVYLGRGGCVPLVGVDQARHGFDTCSHHAAGVISYLKQHPEIQRIILVSRWSIYALGTRFGSETGPPVLIRDPETSQPSIVQNRAVFVRGFQRMLTALEGLNREIVIVTQVPETEYDVPSTMARALLLGRDVELRPSAQSYRERQAFVTGLFASAARDGRIRVFHLDHLFCDGSRCEIADDNGPFYSDSNHITARHAMRLAGRLVPLIEDLLTVPLDDEREAPPTSSLTR